MPWGFAAAAVGTLGAAAISSKASGKAADGQTEAAREATQLQKEQFDKTEARNAPFVSGGTQAFNELLSRLGLAGDPSADGFGSFGKAQTFDPGDPFKAPTADEVMAGPGYQFGLTQGQNALDRRASARGTSYSGAALAEASRYAGDYATGRYGDEYNRQLGAQQQGFNQRLGAFGANLQGQQQGFNQLMAPISIGQASANGTAAAGQQFASTAGNNLIGAANAQGANAIAQGNIWGNALNQGASMYNQYQQNKPNGGGGVYGGTNGTTNTWSSDPAGDPWYQG